MDVYLPLRSVYSRSTRRAGVDIVVVGYVCGNRARSNVGEEQEGMWSRRVNIEEE